MAEQQYTSEHQQNINLTPRNKGTLHKEEQLHLNIDYKLKFNEHLESILKRAGQNVNAILRILPFKNFEKRHIFINFFYITVSFYYFPLVRMFCSHKMNNKINHLQERCLCIVCSGKTSSFGKLLETNRLVPMQIRNLQVLVAGYFKESKDLTPTIFSEFFSKRSV